MFEGSQSQPKAARMSFLMSDYLEHSEVLNQSCSDAQVLRCSCAQMPRCSDAQMLRCSDAQMRRSHTEVGLKGCSLFTLGSRAGDIK